MYKMKMMKRVNITHSDQSYNAYKEYKIKTRANTKMLNLTLRNNGK